MLRFTIFLLINLNVLACQTRREAGLATKETTASAEEAEGYPHVVSFVTLEKIKTKGPNITIFKVHIETSLEVWCERHCSLFKLSERLEHGVLRLEVRRIPQTGNTKPSLLKEDRMIEVDGKNISKIVIANVGEQKNDLDLVSLLGRNNENIHLGFARISSSMAIGGESAGYSIRIAGRSLSASVKDQALVAQIASNPQHAISGFVTGTVHQNEGVERGVYSEFEVKSVDTSKKED